LARIRSTSGCTERVELLELGGLAEDDPPQRTAVEHPARLQNRRAPALDDGLVGSRPHLDRPTRQDVGVDDRRSALAQELGDSGLSAADVASKADEKHGDGRNGGTPRPSYEPQPGAASTNRTLRREFRSISATASDRRAAAAESATRDRQTRMDIDEGIDNAEGDRPVRGAGAGAARSSVGEDPSREGLLAHPSAWPRR
jgi:hypothetical protein